MNLVVIFGVIAILMIIIYAYLLYVIKTMPANKVSSNYHNISFKESLDLTDMPIVTFESKGKKINLLLDTGCNISTLNNSILKDVEFEKDNNEYSNLGIEGNKIDTIGGEVTLHYKNHTFKTTCIFQDLDNAFEHIKRDRGVQLHGVLGTEFFKKYQYILDFEEFKAYYKK